MSEAKVPYPEAARRAGVEGLVIVAITVDSDGNVTDAKIVSGPGYGLEEAALQGIKKFRFKPATKNGEPVSTELKYRYRFTLD
jgi:protein TonB